MVAGNCTESVEESQKILIAVKPVDFLTLIQEVYKGGLTVSICPKASRSDGSGAPM